MLSIVLRALAQPGSQADIAQQLGLSESTVSRLKNEHLEPLCGMLALAGLKIVPADVRYCRPEQLNALLVLARERLVQVESADELAMD